MHVTVNVSLTFNVVAEAEEEELKEVVEVKEVVEEVVKEAKKTKAKAKSLTELWTELGKVRKMLTGRHKDKTFWEVFETEVKYTAWAEKHTSTGPSVKENAEWIRSQPVALERVFL